MRNMMHETWQDDKCKNLGVAKLRGVLYASHEMIAPSHVSLIPILQVFNWTIQGWCQWCMTCWYLNSSHFSDAYRHKICQIWINGFEVMKLTKLKIQFPNLNYYQILFIQKLKQILYLESSQNSEQKGYKVYWIWIWKNGVLKHLKIVQGTKSEIGIWILGFELFTPKLI